MKVRVMRPSLAGTKVPTIDDMGMLPREQYTWKLRTRTLVLGERTRVMGIVNATPDSFSDGGEFAAVNAAVAHAVRLLDEGADIIDIGGESTRPGAGAGTAEAVSEVEEQRRVLPVIEALLRARPDAIVSVDTYRASTAREAMQLGAEIVNDVSGMQWDAGMARVCADNGCGVVAMHTRGLPSEWATQARLGADEIVPLVMDGLRSSVAQLARAGCARESIVLDPGFGFGKRGDENWVLLRELDRLRALGFPVLVGLSRKGFLRSAVASTRDELDEATAAANAIAAVGGAHVVRVHDVARTVRAVAVADAALAAMRSFD
jgi:dihydropteroate synthase